MRKIEEALLNESPFSQIFKAIKETVEEQVAATKSDFDSQYEKYQTNPAGFIREVLGEKNLTPDQLMAMQSVVDNPVTVLQSANGVGKTYIMSRLTVWAYKCFEECQVYTAAAPPEDNLKRLLWGEIGAVLNKNKILFASDKVSTASLEVKRTPLQFITGVTIPQAGDDAAKVARFSGKHAPFLFFFIDEGDAVPKAVYEAIESCLSGGFGRLVISYNPRSKTNPVYQMSQRKEANTIILSAFNHPNVITGENLIPGAVDRETTCRRIVKWTRPLRIGEPVTNTFKVPDFLVGVVPTEKDGQTKLPSVEAGRRKIVLPEFAYMVLGLPSSKTNNQLIDRDWCEAAIYRYKKWVKTNGLVAPYTGDKLAGLDVAEFGNDFSVFTKRILDFVFPQILWGGTDITQTSRNGESLCLEHDIDEIFVDANGLGSGVWSNLVSWGVNAHRIMVQGSATDSAISDGEILGEFDRVRDQMWWACREWLRTSPNAMIPDGETEQQYGLVDQLCAMTYDRTKHGKIKMCDNDLLKEKLGGKSPDEATSLVLTFAPKPNEEGSGDYMVSDYYE